MSRKTENNKDLFYQVQRHLCLLESSLITTYRVLTLARKSDLDGVEFESQNRERIISTIEKVQGDIEEQINALPTSQLAGETLEILKDWTADLEEILQKTALLDQEITRILTSEKENTTREIATIYKAKTSVQGYNLNNLKK